MSQRRSSRGRASAETGGSRTGLLLIVLVAGGLVGWRWGSPASWSRIWDGVSARLVHQVTGAPAAPNSSAGQAPSPLSPSRRAQARETPSSSVAPARASREPADLSKPVGGCGERWALSALADRDAAHVNRHPEETTLAALAQVAPPAGALPAQSRVAAERRTYRVHAVLVSYRIGPHRELRLVLADPNDPHVQLSAAIPAAGCVPSSDQGALFEEERQNFGLRYGEPGPHAVRVPAGTGVVVTGVGKFSQTGAVSPAGLELDPVLNISADLH